MSAKVCRPSDAALKTLMIVARRTIHNNPDNCYLIDRDTGEIKASVYLTAGAYVSGAPQNTYEIRIKEYMPFISYEELNALISGDLEQADIQQQAYQEAM